MTDTAKRLSGPTALSASAVTQYTAPSSTTTTVRNIHVVNENTTTQLFTLSIGTDGAGKRLWYQFPIAAKGVLDWSGFIVLAAADVIQALADATTSLTLTISGIETT